MASPSCAGGHSVVMGNDSWLISWQYYIPHSWWFGAQSINIILTEEWRYVHPLHSKKTWLFNKNALMKWLSIYVPCLKSYRIHIFAHIYWEKVIMMDCSFPYDFTVTLFSQNAKQRKTEKSCRDVPVVLSVVSSEVPFSSLRLKMKRSLRNVCYSLSL